VNHDEYRRVSRYYDRIFERMNRGLRLLGLRMFKPRKSMKVLDIGCGSGTHLEIYKRSGCELYGIDASPSMLEIARSRLGKDAHLQLEDGTHVPFEERTFDLILSMLVLHEMDQSARLATIAEMKRVLKTNGRILWIDFHAGRARFPKGWWPKLVILLSELAAGRRHYRNYRHFVSIGGLPTLVEASELRIESQKVVGDGTMALLLLKA
jgi:ubiquinone/menaquinone biosynthesis C-methylase UbiE